MKTLTEGYLKRPLNDIVGQPQLLARMPEAKVKGGGDARISYNMGTGTWFISGQVGNPVPYTCKSLPDAINMAKTVDLYNQTGRREAFYGGRLDDLELC